MVLAPVSVFISYSTDDSAFADRIKTDLQAMGFNTWIDKIGLTPGTRDWDQELRDSMRRTQAMLLLASPHSRRSHYVKDELRLADIYKLLIIPVWVDGQEWIDCVPMGWGSMQYSDARGDRYAQALQEVAAKLRGVSSPAGTIPGGVIADGGSGTVRSTVEAAFPPVPQPVAQGAPPVSEPAPRNPFKGLRAFTSADSKDFFGRDALVDELIASLRDTLAAEQRGEPSARLLTVLGPSGSGKSSVVMAGLVPRLRTGTLGESSQWVYLDPIVPGAHPLEALMVTLSNQLPEKTLRGIREDLEDDDTRGLHLLATAAARNPGAHVVLVIDQFEEIFTLAVDEHERQQFIDLLVTAVTAPRGRVIAVLTLRADFYDRPMRYPALYRLIQRNQHPILPMTTDDLRSVIEKPAALPDVRLTFQGPLVGDLLYELQGQVGALPLLEFTLDQLFQRRNGHMLTLAAYEAIGGVRGALTRHAEATYAALPTDYHRQMARVLFLRLIDPGSTEQDATRRRAAMQELTLPDPMQTRVLHDVAEAFIAAHLLTASETAGVTTIEVSHEALIREWQRLADWLRDGRDDLRLGLRISADTRLWLQRARPVDLLYRGDILHEAQAWMQRGAPNTDEVQFIQAGAVEEKRQQLLEQSRQVKEVKLQRTAVRGTIIAYAALALLLVVAIVFAGFQFRSAQDLAAKNATLQRQKAELQASLPADVTNLNDTGAGSLRNAIEAIPEGGTITFASGLSGTIHLTSELDISQDIVISGPKSGTITISGGNASRVFNVSTDVAVTLANLTIVNGNAQDQSGGGAILVSGTNGGGLGVLTLVQVTLDHNHADFSGGALSDLGGSVNVINSNLTNNTATKSGGGIYNTGILIVTNSTFSGNGSSGNGDNIFEDDNQGYSGFLLVSGGGSVAGVRCQTAKTDQTVSGC